MVSYFYKAGYDATKYNTSESLLHAQVALIADKYDCTSLYKLARTSFANTMKNIESDDWAAIAPFIYDHTTTEVQAHVELRGLVVAAVTGHHSVLNSTLQNEGIVEFLRSNGHLATDLLLGRVTDVSEHIFMCDSCHYAHTGAPNCVSIAFTDSFGHRTCPKCGKGPETSTKRHTLKVALFPTFPCPSCDGTHTVSPDESPEEPFEPVPESLFS
jgi:hypothetical protein